MFKKSGRVQRHFVYADVARFLKEVHPDKQDSSTQVREIEVMEGTAQPMWLVTYDSLYHKRVIQTLTMVVCEETDPAGLPRLAVIIMQTLPAAGCSTQEEEDVEIVRRDAAWRSDLHKWAKAEQEKKEAARLQERAKFFLCDIERHEDGTYSLTTGTVMLLSHASREEIVEYLDTMQACYESVEETSDG